MDMTQQQQQAAQREARLVTLYQNLEDLMDSFELYVQQQQKSLEQRQETVHNTLIEIEQAAQQAQTLAQQATQQAQQAQAQVDIAIQQWQQLQQAPINPQTDTAAHSPAQYAQHLAQQGLDETQIAREMGIARTGVRMLLQMHTTSPTNT